MALPAALNRPHRMRAAALASLALAIAAGSGCADRGPGSVTAWIADERSEVLSDSPPVLESAHYSAARGEARVFAARNETVAVQLVVRPQQTPAGPFQVYISDFSGMDATLAATQIARLYRARYVTVESFDSWFAEHADRPPEPLSTPDMLVPWEAPRGGGPLRLDEARNEIVWIDLHIPADAPPGVYAAQLALRGSPEEPPAFAAKLVLDVLPALLPSAPSLPVICRFDPTDLLVKQAGFPRAAAESNRLLPDSPAHAGAIRSVRAAMELLQSHRTNPVLWGSFPKYRLVDDGVVELDWQPYDALVGGWLSGEAFANGTPLSYWIAPFSSAYPDAAQHGGFDSPRYARVLSAYAKACQTHFDERRWPAQLAARVLPPERLTAGAVERVQRVAGILKQSGAVFPLIAHLPAASLRGLGWHGAPEIDAPEVGVWSPPAEWFEPEALATQQQYERRAWFVPGRPPYSGSLSPGAPAVDPLAVAWQAYRYGVDGIWIENAGALDARSGPSPGLLYAGSACGLEDQVAPSMRLKRLRRGIQDVQLLHEVAAAGMPGLSQATARQVVRWAFTDACRDHLLDCRESGWRRDGSTFALARLLLLRELRGPAASQPAEDPLEQNTADWARIMTQSALVSPEVDGVRLVQTEAGFEAHAFVSVSNGMSRALSAVWDLPLAPLGWNFGRPAAVECPAGARRSSTLKIALDSIAYNTAGAYPFQLALDTVESGAFNVAARLAAATCPRIDEPPVIDGDLSDWNLASSNAAGDFLLCRGARTGPDGQRSRVPTAATQAFFAMDGDAIYIAIRCALPDGKPPVWAAENTVPMDGIVPWGQDVVEVLLNPRNVLKGTPADLFVLQVKPNGLLVSRRGALTDPPMGPSEDWPSAARVAVRTFRDAWVVELALPLASLGPAAVQNRVWGFNVARLDARRGEYSSWSGARGHCYSPSSMGNLVLLRP